MYRWLHGKKVVGQKIASDKAWAARYAEAADDYKDDLDAISRSIPDEWRDV